MPKIFTKKEAVILNDPQATAVGFSLADGHVVLAVKNDQVTHAVHCNPQEALELGVALIQLAGHAAQQAKMVGDSKEKQRLDNILAAGRRPQ